MTPKERIIRTVKRKPLDFIPYHSNLTEKIKDKLALYYEIPSEDVEDHIGNHFLSLFYTGNDRYQDKRIRIDEFGVQWDIQKTYDTGDWGMVRYPLKDTNLESYTFPDPKSIDRFSQCRTEIEKHPNRFNILKITGLFDTAWHVTGFENLLMSMADEDKTYINTILDQSLSFILGILEQVPSSFDGVRFIEDWGQQKGLLMGLSNWKKHLKPRLHEMYAFAKEQGLTVIAHSCGDNIEIIPELIEMGGDIYDPMQPEVMDIVKIKKEFGSEIVFFGGLGCQSTIPKGTPGEVLREARETLRAMSPGGGYILGPAGAIPTDAPIENVAVLVDFCRSMEKRLGAHSELL